MSQSSWVMIPLRISCFLKISWKSVENLIRNLSTNFWNFNSSLAVIYQQRARFIDCFSLRSCIDNADQSCPAPHESDDADAALRAIAAVAAHVLRRAPTARIARLLPRSVAHIAENIHRSGSGTHGLRRHRDEGKDLRAASGHVLAPHATAPQLWWC